jgi:hypothetical protein
VGLGLERVARPEFRRNVRSEASAANIRVLFSNTTVSMYIFHVRLDPDSETMTGAPFSSANEAPGSAVIHFLIVRMDGIGFIPASFEADAQERGDNP